MRMNLAGFVDGCEGVADRSPAGAVVIVMDGRDWLVATSVEAYHRPMRRDRRVVRPGGLSDELLKDWAPGAQSI